MDVNPIIPPVNRGGIIAKRLPLVFRKAGRKNLDILRLEYLFVVQNERLVTFQRVSGRAPVSPGEVFSFAAQKPLD